VRVGIIVVGCALLYACGGSSDGRLRPDAGEPRDASATDDASLPPDAESEVGACEVVAPTVCPDPMLRYDDVSPIFAARCASCHNGSDGMWPLSTYQHVADWYGEIRAQMLACTMPPVDSGQTMPLEERLRILDWIRCGFPR
jgi:hypothetical protein